MLNAVIEVCRSLERPQAGRSVAELAADLGYSERHLRRRFVEVIGVTAGAYARAQRERRVRDALLAGDSVTGSIVASGYGSFSAFYDKGAPTLGMAPGRYRDGGLGERISFTTIATPLGVILVGCTSRGVCAVRLGEHVDALESELVAEFPQAHIERDDESLLEVALVVAGAVRGERDATHLPLDVAGTAFQIRVWAALRSIPLGETRTYSDIAHAIGASSSIRAVASACAANGAALTIPCHRVIRRDGTLGGYRWGVDAKVEILRNESAAASKSVKNSGIR
jgi:AraC family transcriptional regulator of adaptative response/methylated-DNA-[protein]-cysteine methyltransferase